MPLVGAPEHRGETLIVIGVDSPGGGVSTIELDDVSQFNEFSFQCQAGGVVVQVSLDGVNFTANNLAWEDHMSTTPATRDATLGGGVLYVFRATIKSIRIQDAGGGIAAARLMCGKTGRG